MKEYKYKINGNNYNVSVGDLDDNKVEVLVNGVPYKVELEKKPEVAVQAVKRPAAAPRTATGEKIVAKPAPAAGNGFTVKAPLPGTVLTIPVKVGEAYFVGGGCPHALGEGCFVIEVQKPADITLGARPYSAIPDAWKKPGEDEALYNERLLGAYVYDGCSYEENLRRWRAPRKLLREGPWGQENIVIGPDQTKFFSFTELNVKGKAPMYRTGFPQVAIVTAGHGKLTWAGGELPIEKGKELFFPVDIPDFAVEGDCALVLCNPEGVTF